MEPLGLMRPVYQIVQTMLLFKQDRLLQLEDTSRSCKNLTLNGSFIWTGNGTLSIHGDINGVNGSTTGTRNVIIAANSVIATGTTINFNSPIVINAGVTVTNNGFITISNTTSGLVGINSTTSTWTNSNNSILEIYRSLLSNGILNASAIGNTVIYSGNVAQNVKTPSGSTYYNLTISGSNTKTLQAAIEVNGNLTFSAGPTLDVSGNNYTITIEGDWINQAGGQFNERQGNVIFSGSINQTISGNPTETFYGLTVNKTGGEISFLTGDVIVSNLLTMTAGNIDAGAYVLILNPNTTGSLIHTSGTIIGRFRRGVVTTGVPYLFPVGTASYYRPAIFNFSSLAATNITAEFIESTPGSFTPYSDDGSNQLDYAFTDGYWRFSSTSIAVHNYSLSLKGDGFSSYSIDGNSRISGRNAGNTTWRDIGTPCKC